MSRRVPSSSSPRPGGPQFTDFLRGPSRRRRLRPDGARRPRHRAQPLLRARAGRAGCSSPISTAPRSGPATAPLLALNQEARITGAAPRAAITGQRRYPHHLCHAAYGLWGSPFDAATALVVDGMGETGAAAIYRLDGGRITELRRHRGRGSIGFLYGLITDLAGFDQVKGEEWKIMGLAPYGDPDPDLAALLGRLCTVADGRLRYADAETVRAVAGEIRARRPADALDKGWADLARCGQDLFGTLMDVLVAEARALAPSANLVIAGGCGLNSSYNGRVLGRSGFRRLHVPLGAGRRRQRRGRRLARLRGGPSGLGRPARRGAPADALSRLPGLDAADGAPRRAGAPRHAGRPRGGDPRGGADPGRGRPRRLGPGPGGSSAPGRWATARSWPIRGRRAPRTRSMPR